MATDHLARSTAGAGSGRRAAGAGTHSSSPLVRHPLNSVPSYTAPAITVLVVTEQGVVTAGIAAVMAGIGHVSVRGATLAAEAATDAVDVVVYDLNGLQRSAKDLDCLIRRPNLPVLALTFENGSGLGQIALDRGVDGLILPGLPVQRIRALILDAAQPVGGVKFRRVNRSDATHRLEAVRTCDDFGLTPRELHVLRLIGTGISNASIAEQTHLSINSIKTYIRSAYRRIGVERRSQAVAWCYQYGLGDATPAASN